ncbi:uncharacterized protein LOC109612793 [Musca domestica]|uniref:Uncharacterized protein LOC109612793 n=1 Tax=Musca domestica TaxID=7370 RepID=A0A9J7DJ54_MUSDO|nr:uncharacterized protein LOC109612793 [Musca domestica]
MGKFLVIMQTAKHLQRQREVQRIFEKAFKRNIVDIVVAIYAGNSTFHWYTYDVFRPGHCRQVMPRKFNTFRKGILQSKEIFPNKLKNFHQCPLNIAMRPPVPVLGRSSYMTHALDEKYWGMQGETICLLAKKLNFQTIRHPINESLVSEVYKNGTVTGVFYDLKQKKFDILMGYYKYLTRTRYFGSSSVYFLTPTVVVTTKRWQLDGEWLLAPFGPRVWLLYIFALTLQVMVVQLLRCISKIFKLTWLDILGLALGNSRNIQYQFQSTRYFVMLIAFAFMVINGSFQGKLYAAFHLKSNRGLNTVSELIAKNYTFLKKKFILQELLDALQVPRAQIKELNYTDDFESYEQMLEFNYPVAMLTNYWQHQAFIRSRRLYDDFNTLPGIVVLNQVCAYTRPQSYLLEPFNRIVDNLNSAGILKKWMMDFLGIFDSQEELKNNDGNMNITPIALSLEKIRLVFIGLLITTLIQN